MNIDSALEKIYSLKQFHIKLGLDNITALLKHLDNPHVKLKSIHVAGSNGKGSTCSFIASILQECGYKVGLYTSPHFVRFNERIRINGIEIRDEIIIDFLESNKNYIDKEKPTFFEITTALAFDHFNNNDVDFAVIETGLGGRLDATNTLDPIASVITSISLEHSHILGDSLKKIAYEKGGIIKKGRPIVIGDLPDEAIEEIKRISEERDSSLFQLNDYAVIDDEEFRIGKIEQSIQTSNIGLSGKHQQKNAALAILTIIKSLNMNIEHSLLVKGLKNVKNNTGIQGRYEKIGGSNPVIFDAAHNLEGIEFFIEEFRKEFQKYSKSTLIFGAMRDKEIGLMLNKLNPFFDSIYVTSTNYDRAATSEEIKDIADTELIKTTITDDPISVFTDHINRYNNECLVILGSIYLIGEIKKQLNI